ncbi:hypothetical protein TREMEDRAFT_67574 [Tremella mesenterica DSM 1558]|uniref:uncharacterized protein n=1 Tax=Tremella mesenterica (strain ATCC 24925 / CBS 8224 / DSM 1558 / NBRC 9311 / NRRL Y-6157 / RJB 2259-6 / UBC 559-6) TaxID=578456 RepID=UPI0003F494CE|nr:uncharacterized protein TREMEDRAFT_67574 [Tremella mesenterica DSM 1558]EIW71112.1 hypothetical protein TREMEDRAFT_67574 [Tremella mesenterica DSM 1558]
MSRHVTAIVAATSSGGIGLNGTLPWRLPGEMKYFAKVTSGRTKRGLSTHDANSTSMNTVIMGRKTWESIPAKFRPLPNRRNVIISRQGANIQDNDLISTHTSIEHAIEVSSQEGRIFLIGGAQLYNLAFSPPYLCDRVLLTRVLNDFQCDTFLSPFPFAEQSNDTAATSNKWERRSHADLCHWIGFDVAEENEEKGIRYRFEMWTLKNT